MKLHPRNHHISVVRSALQLSFLHCDDDLHKKWTEEDVRRSSHELMHEIALMRHAGAFGYGRRMLH